MKVTYDHVWLNDYCVNCGIDVKYSSGVSCEKKSQNLEQENEQLRKDLQSMQAGMAQAQRSLEEAIRNLTRYLEYKIPNMPMEGE